jgi:hypothetical protein
MFSLGFKGLQFTSCFSTDRKSIILSSHLGVFRFVVDRKTGAIGVRSPVGAKDFSSSLCVQTSSEANPASCTMGTGCPFPGGKARPGRDADHSPQYSAGDNKE